MNPAELKYNTSHEWVAVEGETGTIGITDFAVKELTDLVHIDLPDVGTKIVKGDEFGEVESVKAVSDLYAPVTGTVTEVNSSLTDDDEGLSVLSTDAFGGGWMIKVKLDDPSELDNLLDHPTYLDQTGQA